MQHRSILIPCGVLVLATAPSVEARQRPLDRDTEPPVPTDHEVRLGRVRLSTGVELEVAETGPRDGRPVLFLHGYTDSWFSYTRILDRLPPDIRAIVPSQRGHGNSERPRCCYLIADLARDAVALLDALGIERADVVGHSTGSFTAQRIAIDHAGRVNRLVLIGSGTTHVTPPLVELNQLVQTLTDPIAPEFVREFQVSTAHQPLPPAFLERVVSESMKLPARVWRDMLAGALSADAKDELDRIQASTLLLWGEHDGLWDRAHQDGLARAIPRARLIGYGNAGHAPHWDVPDRVAHDLSAFLTGTDPR